MAEEACSISQLSAGGSGQEWLCQEVGVVKSVCGNGHDWSRIPEGACGIGQDCLWEREGFFYDFLQEQMRLVKSVGAGGCGQEYLWEQVGLIKSGCGSGWD